jgi:hypothetical protein
MSQLSNYDFEWLPIMWPFIRGLCSYIFFFDFVHLPKEHLFQYENVFDGYSDFLDQ